MKTFKQDNKKEEGQSLIEFALILPVLLFLILGIIEYGYIFMAQITANNAAREAARIYAVKDSISEAQNSGNAVLATVYYAGVEGNTTKPNPVTVTSTNTGTLWEAIGQVDGYIKPIVGFYIKKNYPINVKVYMRIEYK